MGTDTMAYTATALSFMLENLGKPVVFTGSQVPIGEFIGTPVFDICLLKFKHILCLLAFAGHLFEHSRTSFGCTSKPNYGIDLCWT